MFSCVRHSHRCMEEWRIITLSYNSKCSQNLPRPDGRRSLSLSNHLHQRKIETWRWQEKASSWAPFYKMHLSIFWISDQCFYYEKKLLLAIWIYATFQYIRICLAIHQYYCVLFCTLVDHFLYNVTCRMVTGNHFVFVSLLLVEFVQFCHVENKCCWLKKINAGGIKYFFYQTKSPSILSEKPNISGLWLGALLIKETRSLYLFWAK